MTHKNWKKIGDTFASFRDLSIVGIGDLSSGAISAVFWLYMAAIMNANQYGEISYLLAIAGMSSTLASLGSQNTLVVYTAKNSPIQSTVFLLVIVSGCIAAVILFFIFGNTAISAYVLTVMISGLAVSEILGRKQYEIYAKYLITQKILMFGLGFSLYYVLGMNGVIIGIGCSFLIYVTRIYNGFKTTKIDFSFIKLHRNFMSNVYVSDIFSALNGSIDRIIIMPILGFVALGNYQLGIQFLAITYVLPNIISKYIVPDDATGISNTKIKKLSILLSAVFSILGIVLSPMIIPIVFPKFDDAVQVIQITSLAVVPHTISAIYSSKLLGTENTRTLLLSSIVNFVVLLLALLTIGQTFGINGMAFSYVISVIAVCLFFYVANRMRKITLF